jgi:DNA-binding response OmpR family regulator
MKVRVYLVEDSSIMSNLLWTLVRANGATVVGRSDAAPAAIDDILRLRPDLVVIDIGLKKGNGFDVLKALENQTGGKRPSESC